MESKDDRKRVVMNKIDTWNALRMPLEAIGECKFCVNASLTGKTGVCLECIKTMEVRKDRHRIHWEYSGSREEQKVNPN